MEESVLIRGTKHPMLDPIWAISRKKGKIVSAEEAVELIHDGDAMVTAGFVGARNLPFI